MKKNIINTIKLLIILWDFISCCDLEEFFSAKEVSIEEALDTSDIAFRGFSTPLREKSGENTVYFDLVMVYKGEKIMDSWRKLNNYFSKINVTFPTRPSVECVPGNEVPMDYIIFANLIGRDLIQAESVVKWDESADARVWQALGWSKWNDWSSCSVSCSKGIQQRTRHCLRAKCSGFNIQQRHCNLFSCNKTVTPLALKEDKFFHPSRDRWQTIPDRPTAWRLTPDSYIWIPAIQLFLDDAIHNIPTEFSLAVTMRIPNTTLGTIFSLRSRSRQHIYLSLEVAGSDLKLIHAADSGTDVVRIPAGLSDRRWHQIAFSIRDASILDVYVDCEWARTEILLAHSLEVPDDCDIIIGYLFEGDLEQLSLIKDPHSAKLQCSNIQVPIDDPEVQFTKDGFKLFTKKNLAKSRKHRY